MNVRNRAQAIIANAFQPDEWIILCADPQFQELFEKAVTTQQAEDAIITGSEIVEDHKNHVVFR